MQNTTVREMPPFPSEYQPFDMPAAVKIRPAHIKTIGDAMTEFSAAMLKAFVGKTWNVKVEFKCPLCGGTAIGFSFPENGRRKAQCKDCHIRVVERPRC